MSDRNSLAQHTQRLNSRPISESNRRNGSSVFSSIELPCGRSVQNRLVKVSMYEHLATFFGGPPNEYHFALYSMWAQHKWGMIMTGNVQITKDHLTLGRDMILPLKITKNSLEPFVRLAASMHGFLPHSHEIRDPTHPMPLAIMQLSHAGRQSSNILGGRFPFFPPLAPSPIRVGASNQSSTLMSSAFHRMLFQTPKEMTMQDMEYVVSRYVDGARLALQAGFDGVQLHVAHGYLLAEFISPKSNVRTDDFSAIGDNSLRLLRTIVSRIRSAVPTNFVLGIKLSAADYSADSAKDETDLSSAEENALCHVLSIGQWGTIDFIEISGGDYENPDFMASTSTRQAFFSRFSQRAVEALEKTRKLESLPLPLILLTGGFRTPILINAAISAHHAHLVGIGRGSILCPNLPDVLENSSDDLLQRTDRPFQPEPNLTGAQFLWWIRLSFPNVPLIGAGIGMAWYIMAMRYLAFNFLKDQEAEYSPDYNLGGLGAIFWMWIWVPWRLYKPRPIYCLPVVVALLHIVYRSFISYPATGVLANQMRFIGVGREG